MKTAVCLSGHVRYFNKVLPNFIKVFSQLSPDVFIHTWENAGYQIRNSGYQHENEVAADFSFVEKLSDHGIVIRNMVVENENMGMLFIEDGKYKQQVKVPNKNILSMFRKVELANNLKKEYESKNKFEYDIVFKCRFDMLFQTGLLENEIENVLENKALIYVPCKGLQHPEKIRQINDHFAFGSSESINYYSDLYSKIDSYYSNDVPVPPMVTEENCGIHSETLLNFHMKPARTSISVLETQVAYILPHKHASIISKFQNF